MNGTRGHGLDASDARKFVTNLQQNTLKYKMGDMVPTAFRNKGRKAITTNFYIMNKIMKKSNLLLTHWY